MTPRRRHAGLLGSPVVRAGSVAAVIRAAGLLTVFVLQIFLARAIADPSAFGVYAWGQNLMFLLGSLFALGIPLASSRLVAVHAQLGHGRAQRAVIRRATRLVGVFSAGFVGLALLLVGLMPGERLEDIPTSITVLAILAAPLVALTQLYQAIGRAQSQLVAAFAPTQVLRPLLTGLLALAILLAGSGPLGAVEALAAVSVSLLVVLALQLILTGRRPMDDHATAAPSSDPAHGPDALLPAALPIFATRLSELVTQYASIFVLGFIAGPAAVAGYFVADRLAQLAAIPGLVVGSVIQPWLAGASASQDHDRLQQVITQAIHVSLWPTLAVTTVVYVAAGPLLGLFGSSFSDAAPVLLLLMLANVITVVLGPNSQILVMSGRQKTVFRIMTAGAVLHLLLIAALIPAHGAIGAAWASVVSALLTGSACLWVVRTRLRLKSSILLGPFGQPAGSNPDAP